MKFSCPTCHRVLAAKDGLAAKAVRCPYCKSKITVPLPAGRPESAIPLTQSVAQTSKKWGQIRNVISTILISSSLIVFYFAWTFVYKKHEYEMSVKKQEWTLRNMQEQNRAFSHYIASVDLPEEFEEQAKNIESLAASQIEAGRNAVIMASLLAFALVVVACVMIAVGLSVRRGSDRRVAKTRN